MRASDCMLASLWLLAGSVFVQRAFQVSFCFLLEHTGSEGDGDGA